MFRSKSESAAALRRGVSIQSCLLVAALLGCSRHSETPGTGGEPAAAATDSAASPKASEAAALAAAKDYAAALCDGGWQGMFRYDHEYRTAAESAKASVPPSMWPEKESRLQAEWSNRLDRQRQGSHFDLGSGGDCFAVLKSGALIDFSKFEARQSPNEGAWQAFVPFSYALRESAPAATWAPDDERRVKGGLVGLIVETGVNGAAPFVMRTCTPVEGTFIAWERPPLTREMAAELAAKAGVLPTSYAAPMSGQDDPRALAIGLSGARWGGWADYVAASERLKDLVQKDGFVVSGFDRPSPGYYAMGGLIHLSDDQATWIVRSVNSGRYVALLADPTSELTTFEQNGGEAQGVFQIRFKQVTSFGTLWKDLQTQGMVDGAFSDAFGDAPPVNQDLNTVQKSTTVKFRYYGTQGWVIAR